MTEKIKSVLLWIFIFLLPTQLGKHFFLPFSYVSGVRIDYLAPTIYLVDIILLLLSLLYLDALKKHIVKNRRILLLSSMLFIVNIVLAPVPYMAIYVVARLIEVYIVYVIFAQEKKNNLPLIISAFLFGAIVQSCLTTLQFIFKGSLQGPFYFLGERFFTQSTPGIATTSLDGKELLRPYGTFSHPNSLGGFYVALYALSLGLLSQTKKLVFSSRISLMGLATLSSLLVFFSFSKAAIGTFLFITVIHALLQFVNKPLKDKKRCLPCMIPRILVPLILGIIFFQAKGDVYSVDKRLMLIEQTLILFQQHPLFGVGFGNNLYLQAQFPAKYAEFFLQPVHNIFLLFMVQGGLILTSLFGWIALQGIHKKRLLIVAAVVMTGLVDHYWMTLIQNMLLLGVIFSLE